MSNPAHEKSMPDEGAKGSRHGQPLIGAEDALEALTGGLYRTLNIGPCCINVRTIVLVGVTPPKGPFPRNKGAGNQWGINPNGSKNGRIYA